MYTLLRLISFVQQLLQFYLHSFLWKKILISLYAGINILCGIGLLTTPYAIKEGGWLSLIFLVIFAFFCCYTGVLLKECLESSPGLKTYPDIGQAAFGLAGRLGIAVSPIWIWNGQFLNKHACIYKHILNVVMYATYNKHDYHWACIYKQKPLLFGSLIDTWFCSNADIFVCRTICKCKNSSLICISQFSLPFLVPCLFLCSEWWIAVVYRLLVWSTLLWWAITWHHCSQIPISVLLESILNLIKFLQSHLLLLFFQLFGLKIWACSHTFQVSYPSYCFHLFIFKLYILLSFWS